MSPLTMRWTLLGSILSKSRDRFIILAKRDGPSEAKRRGNGSRNPHANSARIRVYRSAGTSRTAVDPLESKGCLITVQGLATPR